MSKFKKTSAELDALVADADTLCRVPLADDVAVEGALRTAQAIDESDRGRPTPPAAVC